MFFKILENSFTKKDLCYYEGVIKATNKGHSQYKTKTSQSTGVHAGDKQGWTRAKYLEKNKCKIKITQ